MSAKRLKGRLAPVTALDRDLVSSLYALMVRHYDALTRERFEQDLAEKDWVILMEDPQDGTIRGFSTILFLDRVHRGRAICATFSGDTIIDPAYWGDQTLVRTWCELMGRWSRTHPDRDLYWFLLTKGYRTYLYLPLYFHRFLPRHDHAPDVFETSLLDELARSRYGEAYDPVTGRIEFETSHGQLTSPLARIPDRRRGDPHVEFFLLRNPGYVRGTELACLARIAPGNMRGLALRALERGMDEGAAEATAPGVLDRSGLIPG